MRRTSEPSFERKLPNRSPSVQVCSLTPVADADRCRRGGIESNTEEASAESSSTDDDQCSVLCH